MHTTPDGVPPFRLILPDGWEELPADRSGTDALIRRSSAVLRAQHRPDLDAQLRTMLEVAYRKMKQGRAFAVYVQTSAEQMPLPMSITASVVSGQLGGTLDRQVAGLIRDRGAGFLRDDRTIIRWETPADVKAGAEAGRAQVVDYLIPIPGSRRRDALQFTTVIPVPANDVTEVVSALVDLSDLMVSTFTWKPAEV
ncbi:hypothetical protein [Microbacterium allomyrinae]|uniref:Uncharacterized protein n=1 Tax=Microbacterium allomyrinae TaxID=2830666 RepID=A0A9X1LXT0_9MICO|nr:hypothetical protein [Microbacterium allomyrinae]MCC2033608.1 hypothetical protein [Microbacterium allomyrinae]